MYIVVSKWNLKGDVEGFDERAMPVRSALASQPGVEFVHSFTSEDGGRVAVIGYADQGAYERIVGAQDGPFQRALAENRLEEVAEWVWSERGEAVQ